MTMHHFISDNASGIHPRVLQAINEANNGHEVAYGHDRYSAQSKVLFKHNFGPSSESLFLLTGTAANVISLQSVMQSFEAVICADCSHLHKDECGAPEKTIGCKVLIAKTKEGKVTIDTIQPLLRDTNMVHRAQPKVLSIAQCTEWGTIYTPDEIKLLSEFCHNNGLLLHIDGSRFCNAAAALDLDFKAISQDCDIDLLSFGATKNGAFGAEAIIFFNTDLSRHAEFFRKQNMQLISKMRFVAAQFIALLEQDLWRELARHANQMATLLANEVNSQVEIVMPVQSNVVFAKLPSIEIVKKLQSHYQFALWDSKSLIVRWMTSFDTTTEEVKHFAQLICEMINE